MPAKICDFCSQPDPEWSYPALDIKIHELNAVSLSNWLACEACHQLIQSEDRHHLAQRAMHSPYAAPTYAHMLQRMGPSFIYGLIWEMQDHFFLARTGQPPYHYVDLLRKDS